MHNRILSDLSNQNFARFMGSNQLRRNPEGAFDAMPTELSKVERAKRYLMALDDATKRKLMQIGVPSRAFDRGGAFDASLPSPSRSVARDADADEIGPIDSMNASDSVDEVAAWVGRRLNPEMRDRLVEQLQAIDFDESARQQAQNNLPSAGSAEDSRRVRRPTSQDRTSFNKRFPDAAKIKQAW